MKKKMKQTSFTMDARIVKEMKIAAVETGKTYSGLLRKGALIVLKRIKEGRKV